MSDDSWDDEDPFADPRPRRPPAPPSRVGRSSSHGRNDDPFGEDAPTWMSNEGEAPGWAFETDDAARDGRPATPNRRRWLVGAVCALVVLAVASFMLGRVRHVDEPRAEEDSTASESPRPSAPTLTAAPTAAPTTPTTAPTSTTSPGPTTSPVPSTDSLGVSVAAALVELDVKGRAPQTEYDRDAFGKEWADIDRNGCDTRNDILRRDLFAVEIRAGTYGCLVEGGTLNDPYSGRQLPFERGWDTSILVQIDHVVSLSNAWQSGAQFWRPRLRERFANDPLNLLAVDGPLNAQKSDGDAATWLPPDRSYWCKFVSRQVAVKAKYGLSVTPPERGAIVRVLARCPEEPLVSEGNGS